MTYDACEDHFGVTLSHPIVYTMSPLLSKGVLLLASWFGQAYSKPHHSCSPWTNPIADGWYADPDIIKFGDTYWVYATVSTLFPDQTYFDAYSSKDLVNWELHPRVFDADVGATWAKDSFWAPCTIERDGKYYFYYTANNPVSNETTSGMGVAVADSPGGPFIDVIDEPILRHEVNGGNPMDQQVFIDDDGQYYLVWGGTNASIAPLNSDMTTIDSWPDGSGPIEITPEGFVEGAFILKREGIYYLMWSEGGYGTPDYRAAYGMSESLTEPFERLGLMLSKDETVADGPGHHSAFRDGDGKYYVAYHRRIIGDDTPDNRVIAIDRLWFNEDGTIRPVVMT